MMRFAPRSLFGRLMLVLASGLIVAQLLSAAINYVERDRLLLQASGMHPAQRIADIVNLLDSLGPDERQRIVAILNVPPLIVRLHDHPPADIAAETPGVHAAIFSAVLRSALGDQRVVRVQLREAPAASMEAAMRMHERPPPDMSPPHAGPHPHAMRGGTSFLAQVQLRDDTWVSFDSEIPRDTAHLPLRLLLSLVILLLAVLALSFVAVRWITRPLHVLAGAADELGRDINRAPLPEDGPVEVRQAAHAFNTMQTRLKHLLTEKTRFLTAMSHDLKTPIARMRVRTDLLEDGETREKFEKDLIEMETMVTQTLEFMRGVNGQEPAQPVDMDGLLESIQADNAEMGRSVTVDGRASAPYAGVPQLLKRCIANLVDNAVLYGRQAEISVEDSPALLTLRIRDRGPGIPEGDLQKVFEPFFRLESSRSRETGGTGLGLSIARSIAQAHGGDVRLRNRVEGGLEAILELPRRGGAPRG